MTEEQIRDEARKAANRSQIMSNWHYDHKSYEDGFFEGMNQALRKDAGHNHEQAIAAAVEAERQLIWEAVRGKYEVTFKSQVYEAIFEREDPPHLR